MQNSVENQKSLNRDYLILSLNIVTFLILLISLYILSNYNIQYSSQYGAQLSNLGYNYNNIYLFFALIVFIAFSIILIQSVRKKILVKNLSRNSQIVAITLLNLFFFSQTLYINIIGIIQHYQSSNTAIYQQYPLFDFINFSSLISLLIFFGLLIISFIDIFYRINSTSHSSVNKQATPQSKFNSVITFISKEENFVLLAFLDIFFIATTIILGYLVIFYNVQFMSDYISKYSYQIINNPVSPLGVNNIGFTDIISRLASISFLITILLLFYSIRKIFTDSSVKKDYLGLILYGVFLSFLTILFNYYSNYMYVKYNPSIDPYYTLATFNQNITSMFGSFERITIVALVLLLSFIFFKLFIFNKKFYKSNSNLSVSYSHSLMYPDIEGSVKGTERPDHINSPDEKPVIFINDDHSKVKHLVCPKCGQFLEENEVYCQNCGIRL